MSVDIEKKIIEAGFDPKEFVTNPVFICSVCFSAEQIRSVGLRVGYEPLPDNLAHGEVWSSPNSNRFTKAQKRYLANSARWYCKADDIELV